MGLSSRLNRPSGRGPGLAAAVAVPSFALPPGHEGTR